MCSFVVEVGMFCFLTLYCVCRFAAIIFIIAMITVTVLILIMAAELPQILYLQVRPPTSPEHRASQREPRDEPGSHERQTTTTRHTNKHDCRPLLPSTWNDHEPQSTRTGTTAEQPTFGPHHDRRATESGICHEYTSHHICQNHILHRSKMHQSCINTYFRIAQNIF